jgi:hypothetical protein
MGIETDAQKGKNEWKYWNWSVFNIIYIFNGALTEKSADQKVSVAV